MSALVDTRIKHDYKSMLGDARGVYVPVNFYNVPDRKVEGLMKDVSRTLKTDYNLMYPCWQLVWFAGTNQGTCCSSPYCSCIVLLYSVHSLSL